MTELTIRRLRADEIECRINTIRRDGKGLSLLLYKNARVDMSLLDELFGPFGWQRKHELINGNLFCTVSVKDPETGEWISKSDVGTESFTEKEKGQASDAFKRACTNWGLGRELYSSPTIWVKAGNDCKIEQKSNGGGYTCYDRFAVSGIGYDDNGNISQLTIVNAKTGNVVYQYGSRTAGKKSTAQTAEQAPAKLTPEEQKIQNAVNMPIETEDQTRQQVSEMKKDPDAVISGDLVVALKMYCRKHGIPEQEVYKPFGRTKIEELTNAQYGAFRAMQKRSA